MNTAYNYPKQFLVPGASGYLTHDQLTKAAYDTALKLTEAHPEAYSTVRGYAEQAVGAAEAGQHYESAAYYKEAVQYLDSLDKDPAHAYYHTADGKDKLKAYYDAYDAAGAYVNP